MSANGMVDPNMGSTITATCSTGKVVLGGGYSASGGVTILSSRPDVMFSGEWVVQASPSMGSVTAYAICAFVS